MKIAVISYGDSNDMKGAFVATHNRIKHLLLNKNFEIDVFLIQTHDNQLVRALRKSQRRTKEDFFVYDGIRYQNLWFDFSLIDYLLRMKLSYQGPFFFLSIRKWTKLFKNYNFISAHQYNASIVAYNAFKKYKIPFANNWHGADIHSEPFLNHSVFKWTKRLLENATYNFFVSKNLSEISEKIAQKTNKVVLYNGVDTSIFRKYSDTELLLTREKFSITSKSKNVAYIGNLVPIKNAEKLPEIFSQIKTSVPETSFFVIGDGRLRKIVENECSRLDIKVSFLGNQKPSDMPALINCMDLVLLPSINEGLPLITLESMACRVPVIGSRVGGIAEAIGIENTVELNGMFIENFSMMAIDVLNNKREVKINPIFDWEKTAQTEAQHYIKYRPKE